MCGGILLVQASLSDLESIRRWKPLTETQRKILSLLNCQLTQTSIAEKLHLSRPRINQIIKKFESDGLIKRVDMQHNHGTGKRDYNYFYELSARASGLIKGDKEPYITTPARAHHFRRKYHIVQQLVPVSTDKRTGYQKSWKMRGGERHKFWFSKTISNLSVTIDWHPKTLVAYLDKGQNIIARNVEEAEQIGWSAIQEAKRQFVESQAAFGTFIIADEIGKQIAPVHYGFEMKESDPMVQEVKKNEGIVGYADYRVDSSPPEEGICEAETERKEHATRLGAGIQITEALPEVLKQFNEKLNPLSETTNRIEAMMQGSITSMQKEDNLMKYLSSMMLKMDSMEKRMEQLFNENAELKKQLQKV